MEAQGPEAKRPRLDTYNDSSHRGPQYTSIAPSHGHSPYSLPPRNHYPPGAPPPPPSPYYEAGIPDHSRALPDPTGYTHSQSGHNTPAREQRQYAPEASYSRRGSTSGTTRSPDSYQHYAGARPLNNAGTNDGHYPPATYATDSAGHAVGYPNHDGSMNGTPHHGLPMSAYPEHPPTLPPGRPEYSQSPVNTTPHQYPGIAYGPQSNYQMMQRSRKGNRATQACDICRQRKAKCDEGRPKCSFCVENNMNCNYQNVAPAKADRANQAIMDHLGSQDVHLNAQDEKFEILDRKFERFQHNFMESMERMERIEKILLNSGSPQAPLGLPNHEGPERKSLSRQHTILDSPKGKVTPDQKLPPPTLPHVISTREPKVEASPSGSHATTSTDPATGDHSMPAMSPYERVEHTTAAHRLLSWPSIKRLVQKQPTLRKIAANEDYVMQQEESRGTLRVYGIGEGRDSGDGGEPGQNSPAPHSSHASSQHSGSPSSGRGDEGSDAPSPNTASTPPEGIWGYGFIPPVTTPSPPYSGNDLNFDFSLNIHPRTLRRLLDSYLENIQVMHPFLDKVRLTRMIERFSARYNPTEQRLTKSLFSPHSSTMGVDVLRGAPSVGKRKMSDGYTTQNFATEPNYASGSPRREILFERSISTAIVLLVMALGRICEWKDSLPGVPRETKYDIRRNPALGSQYHSPINTSTQSPPPNAFHMSPPLSARFMGGTSAPSPANAYRNSLPSPRSNTEDPAIQQRNVDIIPGLSYYAPATDILGNLHGSNDLAHVQAFLLAGLFTGQLARPWESFNWISSACIACRFLVRDPHLRKEKDPRKNMIKFAFWTCSQLESDILAELDLPRSGIQDITDVQYPNDYVKPGEYHHWDTDKKIMGYYSGQIHIRNSLNMIQTDLYAPANLERATRGFALRDAYMAGLTEWRNALPPELRWADDDPLATHINDARLRAKYYGAKYIIHRPFLRYALDHEIVFDSDTQGAVSQAMDRKNSVMLPPHTAAQTQKSEIYESCKECVHAAMQSTVAFDHIIQKRRLIVTNIFGTAHAQFGNVVVLATTHMAKSPTLSSLVPSQHLGELFERTISFLRSLAPLSDTLGRDALILEGLRQLVFESSAGVAQSFSSMDS